MSLNPFFEAKLAPLAGLTQEGAGTPGILDDFLASPAGWTVPEDVEIYDQTCDGPHGPVGIRVYRSNTSSDSRPGLLWMHGGGFVVGTLDWAEAHVVAAELAHRVGAIVISVDYRLAAGEVTYPVPLDDVIAAWTWLEANARDLGVTSGLYIGGGSAGANLAAAAAMRLRDEKRATPKAMLLAYGVFHFPVPGISAEQHVQMSVLPSFLRGTPEGHIGAFRNYVGNVHHVPVYATPGNGDLRGMPPAAIVVSEYDELRASSETFAAQLEDAGIPVQTYHALGMLHGHLNWLPSDELPEVDATIAFFARFLTRS
ncbi:MAG TPA: alpha/beta hydrolase fold domain-containing protein [Microbacterium sp.]|uniref:alpha/beta hydrolase n=1 Tax=Microbacterium sp. TaxID=51671 RepID=UPI002C2852EF|nr:alpha/beta hydrolase fold domain-containing protein [Microbacterium sp.]HWI32216.1 alpha/beta hydrolase fold domain-containing protein [Microbacterium sp.]